jgi:hypothetical protein
VARWVASALDETDRTAAQVWIRDNRDSILSAALEELIDLREQHARRDEAAEAAVARLNSVYEECQTEAPETLPGS